MAPLTSRMRWTSALLVTACLLTLSTPPAVAAPGDVPQALPRELGKPEDDMTLDIRAFQVDGLPAATAEAMAAVTAPYTGKGKNYEDLMNAAAAVTRYMQRELGYYVGFAYVPEQHPTDGVVHLQALEGRLDRIDIFAPEGAQGDAQRDLITRQLAALQPGEVLFTQDVERAVLLLNDLQGLNVRVEIEEGRTPGTAALRVSSSSDRRVSWRLDADNLGNRHTGEGRGTVEMAAAGLLRTGDSIKVEALSSHTGGLKQATVGYVTPVGAQGLRLGGVVSRVEYAVDKDAFPADYHGSVGVAGAYALYPLTRSRNLNLFGLLSYEHKRFDDKQEWQDYTKSSDDWVLGLIGDSRDTWLGGGINTFELQSLWGRMKFGPGADSYYGLHTSFEKFTVGAARLQSVVPGRLQFYARYKGQVSNTSLDFSERYAAGGPTGVRAFEAGTVAGNKAHVINAELRWLPSEAQFGKIARELMFSVFYDWGRVTFFHDRDLQTWGLTNTTIISGYGAGVTWERTGDISVRAEVAWKGRDPRDFVPETHQPRLNVVLNKRF